jgi:hypothetical protein
LYFKCFCLCNRYRSFLFFLFCIVLLITWIIETKVENSCIFVHNIFSDSALSFTNVLSKPHLIQSWQRVMPETSTRMLSPRIHYIVPTFVIVEVCLLLVASFFPLLLDRLDCYLLV